jgi:hypothetical protein
VLKSRRDNFAGKFHNQNSDLIIYNTDWELTFISS